MSTHKNVMSFTCTMIVSYHVNTCEMKNQNFNFWNVIFWMKIQNPAWFQYKTFLCCNFSFLNIFYIHVWRTCFFMIRKYLFLQITRAYILVVMKSNEWNIRIILINHFRIRNKNTRTLQQFNTHDHFGNLISFSGKSHILANAASLACGWIGHSHLWISRDFHV